MPLVLAPSFDENTREQIEQHLEVVRTRRMVASAVYYQGVNAKLEHESDKIQKKIKSKYERIGNEIAKLDKADEKIQELLNDLTTMLDELNLTQDMIAQNAMQNAGEDNAEG